MRKGFVKLFFCCALAMSLVACGEKSSESGNVSSKCPANTGWSGDKCDQCTGNFFGPKCDQVPTCKHGTPSVGLTGNGQCVGACQANFTGENCDECTNPLKTGENCNECKNSRMTGDTCEDCKIADGTIGKLVDDRDNNKEYKTTMINCQEWMAENYMRAVGNRRNPNNDANNVSTHGLLYDFATVTGKNFCPSGWRMPNMRDINMLTSYVDKMKTSDSRFLALISEFGWHNTDGTDIIGGDDFGFSAQPAGIFTSDSMTDEKAPKHFGVDAHLWITSHTASLADTLNFHKEPNSWEFLPGRWQNDFASVRCIKGDSCAKRAEWNDITGCVCQIGWTGPDCDRCAAGFGGDDCTWQGEYLTDERDFQKYRIVTIGQQTWMAENARYDRVDHYSANNKTGNDRIYGFLYTLKDAQKVCPSGWHLPTKSDFEDLLTFVKNNKKGATEYEALILNNGGWVLPPLRGGDDFGFGAMPAGLAGDREGLSFAYFGRGLWLWSNTVSPGDYYYLMLIQDGEARISDASPWDYYLSVRCLKD